MFTGIIEATATVLENGKGRLVLARPSFYKDVKVGSSVAVSGACLTVTKLTKTAMTFDVIPETLLKTTLGFLKKGDSLNLERAMRADGRFEGHIVQGHIEGVGIVQACHPERSRRATRGCKRGLDFAHPDTFVDVTLTISLPLRLSSFVIAKGSIALDGVSLTVAEIRGKNVTVALIPHTLAETTLGKLRKGDRVNVETDILGRYVRSFRYAQ
ncbi:MAG: riboflavin synthase [Candidatus Peribacteraceae bacterium]|jgi:riboflavin synthase